MLAAVRRVVQILYTGDYSREDDRHLMSAEIPAVSPEVRAPILSFHPLFPSSLSILSFQPCCLQCLPAMALLMPLLLLHSVLSLYTHTLSKHTLSNTNTHTTQTHKNKHSLCPLFLTSAARARPLAFLVARCAGVDRREHIRSARARAAGGEGGKIHKCVACCCFCIACVRRLGNMYTPCVAVFI